MDDVEDDSKVRRGKPCLHKIFGVDVSVNLGPFMLYEPFLYILKSDKFT